MARPTRTGPAGELVPAEQSGALDRVAADGAAELAASGLAMEYLSHFGGVREQIGALKALAFQRATTDVAMAQIYRELSQSRAYLGYPYRDPATGEERRVATLEECCELFFGRTSRRMRELSANLGALGTELYEAAEQIGFRARDYAQLRALPADDQAAVREALESDDRDHAIEVLSALVARQAEQRAAAEAAKASAEGERDEARADYDAASRRLGDATARIARLEGGDRKPMALDEQIAAWPGAAGYLVGEIRRGLIQVVLLIQSLEEAITADPPSGGAQTAVVERACRMLYDQLAPDLGQLQAEVASVEQELDRVIGAYAWRQVPAGGSQSEQE